MQMNSLRKAKHFTTIFPNRHNWLQACISHSHTDALFSQPSVLVSNKVKVVAKIEMFQNTSSQSLQVASDFDSTLTHRYDDEGGKHRTSFSVLECHPCLSDEFQWKFDQLRTKYDPLDADPTLRKEEKSELMKEYSNSAAQLWVNEGISEKMVKEAIVMSKVRFRGGFKELNDSLAECRIPLLILSAGLGTSIRHLLELHHVNQSNMKILSNYLTYDDHSIISGITQPLITTPTKAQTHLMYPEYFECVSERTNLVVLGDRIEDAGVQGCYKHVENVITIGFLNEKVDDLLDLFLETYDIVLIGDPDFSFVKRLFDLIINRPLVEKWAMIGTYPFPHSIIDGKITDATYPGTACERLVEVLNRLSTLPENAFLDKPWPEIRSKLLWCGGLKEDSSTSHAFNDDNHCDLTTMTGNVQENRNADGKVEQISTRNFLGDHIKAASLPELGDGGSWSTCTNGCHKNPPHDVAHGQFQSRVAFKLVWCPPDFDKFVLVDDEGKLLKVGKPLSDSNLPHIYYRQGNFKLTKGGRYAPAAENSG